MDGEQSWRPGRGQAVWIAQCLCPERHCVLAAAAVAASAEEAQTIAAALKKTVAETVANGIIDPWCGLCLAPRESWHIEVARTRWRDLADARAALEECEREQRQTAVLWGKKR